MPFTVAVSGLGEGTTPTDPVSIGDPETFPGLTGATTACFTGAVGATPVLTTDNEATGRGCFAGG